MKIGRHLDGTLGYHDNNNNNVLIFMSCKAQNKGIIRIRPIVHGALFW